MDKTARSRGAKVSQVVGVCGVLAVALARPAVGQQQATVQATARVVVSPAAEYRALVVELARTAARSRPGTPVKVQGSLAMIQLRVARAARPTAVVDVQYLRN